MLLEVAGLEMEYGSVGESSPALTDVGLYVGEGEIVGLVGASGSGKSTVLFSILGLTRGSGRITRGSVRFDGQELLGMSPEEWRSYRGSQIALITQNPRASLNPIVRIGDQLVAVYRAHTGASRREAEDRVSQLMSWVGISDPERRLRAFPHELSGGMAQRVLIALALSCNPRLVLADEPTSGLDTTVQAAILNDLSRAAVEVGASLLLVTHDFGIVANYCDRLYVMESGEIVEEATIADFFAQPAHPAGYSLLAQHSAYRDHPLKLSGPAMANSDWEGSCRVHRRCPAAESASGCLTSHPALVEVAPGHRSRCHRIEYMVAKPR